MEVRDSQDGVVLTVTDACSRMAEWIKYYNSQRLHSAIWYLTPDDIFYGRTENRLAERKEKLHTALKFSNTKPMR